MLPEKIEIGDLRDGLVLGIKIELMRRYNAHTALLEACKNAIAGILTKHNPDKADRDIMSILDKAIAAAEKKS